MDLLLILLPFVIGGAVIGFFWKWQLPLLVALCGGLGFTIGLTMLGWSDFHFTAIVANARAGGSSWQTWLIGGFGYGCLFAMPVAVGSAIGFALRRMMKRVCCR